MIASVAKQPCVSEVARSAASNVQNGSLWGLMGSYGVLWCLLWCLMVSLVVSYGVLWCLVVSVVVSRALLLRSSVHLANLAQTQKL